MVMQSSPPRTLLIHALHFHMHCNATNVQTRKLLSCHCADLSDISLLCIAFNADLSNADTAGAEAGTAADSSSNSQAAQGSGSGSDMYIGQTENGTSSNNVSQGSSDAASRRVQEVLPAVLSLLEECLNALADDAAAAESAEHSGSSSSAVLDDRCGLICMSHLAMVQSFELVGSCLVTSCMDTDISMTALVFCCVSNLGDRGAPKSILRALDYKHMYASGTQCLC